MYALKSYIILLALSLFPLSAKEIQKTIPILSQEEETVPNVPVFSVDFKGEALKCYPVKYIKKNFYERQVEYRCIRKDIKITATDLSHDLSEGELSGQDETKRMQEEVKQKKNIGAIYTVQIPERNARNTWKASNIASRELRGGFLQQHLGWLLPARLYISARPQYAGTNSKQDIEFRDGGSRGGFFYYHEFGDSYELTMQHEAKINWSNISSFINTSSNADSTRRLQYLSLAKGDISALIGKYWSPYYDIAGMTDHFMAYGAEASGTYNAFGDGGASGTGRSDQSLQIYSGRNNHFSSRLQYQPAHQSNNGINSDYSYGFAGNIIYKGGSNIKAGVSVAYGKFDEITSEMKAIGLDGNDFSAIIGGSYKWKELSVSAVLSYTENHMLDDQGIYFDGVGAEFYLRYDFSQSIRFAAGGNWLKPRNSEYHGDFNIRKSIFSLQYTFGSKTFDDLVYVEASIPKGHLANGETSGYSVAIGFRYLFNLW